MDQYSNSTAETEQSIPARWDEASMAAAQRHLSGDNADKASTIGVADTLPPAEPSSTEASAEVGDRVEPITTDPSLATPDQSGVNVPNPDNVEYPDSPAQEGPLTVAGTRPLTPVAPTDSGDFGQLSGPNGNQQGHTGGFGSKYFSPQSTTVGYGVDEGRADTNEEETVPLDTLQDVEVNRSGDVSGVGDSGTSEPRVDSINKPDAGSEPFHPDAGMAKGDSESAIPRSTEGAKDDLGPTEAPGVGKEDAGKGIENPTWGPVEGVTDAGNAPVTGPLQTPAPDGKEAISPEEAQATSDLSTAVANNEPFYKKALRAMGLIGGPAKTDLLIREAREREAGANPEKQDVK